MKKLLTILTFVMLFSFSLVLSTKATKVLAENEVIATTVPEQSLTNLDWDSESGYCYITATTNPVVKYSVNTVQGVDNSLANATDIALRIYTSYSQQNRPNNGNGLCWIRVKFVESDTIYGVKKSGVELSLKTEDGVKSQLVSNGGANNVGGQFNGTPGTDGTLYIPLNALYDGTGTTEDTFGNALTSVDGYQNYHLEYVEYTFSGFRYEFAFGPIAIVRQNNSEVTIEKQNVTGTTATASCTIFKGMIYDKANFKVNGVAATKESDGLWSVTLDGIGKVEFPYDETKGVYAFSPVTAKLIAPGYGITDVAVTNADQTREDAANWTLQLETYNKSYFVEGEIPLRKGFRSIMNDRRNAGTTVWESQTFNVELTVSKLAKVELINAENAPISVTNDLYNVVANSGKPLTLDTSEDGFVYVEPGFETALTIAPKTGFVYRGYKINDGEEVTDETTVKALTIKVNTTENAKVEVLGVGEAVELSVSASEHGSITTTGLEGGKVNTNVFAKVVFTVTPEVGYKETLKVTYTTPAEVDGDDPTVVTENIEAVNGEYALVIPKKATGTTYEVEASFEIVNYAITYRLNGGELAQGETNPETITHFDEVELKVPTKEGYDFLGWRIEGEEEYTEELKDVTSDLTIIAVFELHVEPEYFITYVLPNGVTHNNKESYLATDEVFELEDPTAIPEGYDFVGWFIGETEVFEIDPTDATDLTITCKLDQKDPVVTTAKPTTAPKTNAPTAKPTSKEPTEPVKGCGSSLVLSIALIPAMMVGFVALKKKEEK